jgi:dTDP-4-amino-4,6-dideoxygalactose transaminase
MNRFDIREEQAVQKVIESGELSRFFTSFKGGKENQEFEKEFAQYLDIKHAIAVGVTESQARRRSNNNALNFYSNRYSYSS